MTARREVRRWRGEVRRLAHPVTAACLLGVAATATFMQLGRPPYAGAPSPADAAGALRIALLQHATVLGAVVAGCLAGASVGEDRTTGTIETWRLTDPRPVRRWARRVGVLVLVELGSVLLTAIVLRVAVGAGAAGGPSSLGVLARDGAAALVVIAALAVAALALALWLPNVLLLAAALGTLLSVPSTIGGPVLRWAFPAGWVAAALFLTEGSSIDYLGQRTWALARWPSQPIALAALAALTAVLFIVGARTADRADALDG